MIRTETKRKEIQEQANSTIRMMEMKARQAEKDLSAGHKRRLTAMGVEVEKKRKVDIRAQEELYRQDRNNTRQLENQLQDMQEPKRKSGAGEGSQTGQREVGWFAGIR